MKLNHLFPYISHYTQSSKERGYRYDILRSILGNRRDWGIENNVVELQINRSMVIRELSKLYPVRDVEDTLDAFLAYPEVRNALGDVGIGDQDVSLLRTQENEDWDDETENEDEDEEESESDMTGDEDEEESESDMTGDEDEEQCQKFTGTCDRNDTVYSVLRDALFTSLLIGNVALSLMIATKVYSV